MDSQIINKLVEITKVLIDKENAFTIDIKVDNHVFKVTNQEQKTDQIIRQKWRKTPAQIQRDLDRQQSYNEKKKLENIDFSDVPMANKDKSNEKAQKVILSAPSPNISVKDTGTNTDEDNFESQLNGKDKERNNQDQPNIKANKKKYRQCVKS